MMIVLSIENSILNWIDLEKIKMKLLPLYKKVLRH